MRAGDAPAAEASFQAGLKLDPNSALAWFYLGEAYLKDGRKADAADAYQKSLGLDPNSSVADDARARLPDLAQANAPSAPPPAASSLFSQGFQQLNADDAADAEASFQAGLKLEPANPLAWFYLGEAQLKQGHSSDAAAAYRQSLSLNATSAVADTARARLAGVVQANGPTPVDLPPPPQLAAVPPVNLPASFCSAKDRNAFYDQVYKPALDIAVADNQAAKAYLDTLLALHARYMKTSLDAANNVTYAAVSYQPTAQAAFKTSNDYTALFDTLMAVPIVDCH